MYLFLYNFLYYYNFYTHKSVVIAVFVRGWTFWECTSFTYCVKVEQHVQGHFSCHANCSTLPNIANCKLVASTLCMIKFYHTIKSVYCFIVIWSMWFHTLPVSRQEVSPWRFFSKVPTCYIQSLLNPFLVRIVFLHVYFILTVMNHLSKGYWV